MRKITSRRTRLAGALALSSVAVALVATLRSADHGDAPLIAANRAADINDVYAFRSPADPNRLVLVMTTNPFIPPAEASTTSFSNDVLYQFKLDTDGDAAEDFVVQATFAGSGASQNVTVMGPARPDVVGASINRLLSGAPRLTGPVSTTANANVIRQAQIQVFAGVRDDPFFCDCERLTEILAGQATSFRDPGVDTFTGVNTLAIVVEFPISMIGNATDLGIWGTTSTR